MNDRNNGQEHIRALRDQLAALRARHDHGAIPHATYNVVKTLETSIAWHEHQHQVAMKLQRREQR
jgi:hypothetical protein